MDIIDADTLDNSDTGQMPECLQNMHAHLTVGSLGNSWTKTNLDETVCIETIDLNFRGSWVLLATGSLFHVLARLPV